MKILRNSIAVLVVAVMIFAGVSLCQAEEGDMTNQQLVEMLVNMMGIKVPADVDVTTMTDAEVFELYSNMLAGVGIDLFVDAGPTALVTRGTLATVIYDVLVGPENISVQDKVNAVVNLGYIGPGSANDILPSNEVINILNIPALVNAFAEPYSPPAPRGGGGTGIGYTGGAPLAIPPVPPAGNPSPEPPASQI